MGRTTPGQSTLAFYTVRNLSPEPVIGVSTYNVSPQAAGKYFHKVQCFCFEEQRLLGGEELALPVFFYIDPEFANDPQMAGVDSLTLSYTFFSPGGRSGGGPARGPGAEPPRRACPRVTDPPRRPS